MSSPEMRAATAIVVAGEEATCVLLRGLLRLNRFRVDGEAKGTEEAIGLLQAYHPRLLLVDEQLAEGDPLVLIAFARKFDPQLRVVLCVPASDPFPVPLDAIQRPDAVLTRPFRIQEFVDAVTLRETGIHPTSMGVEVSPPQEPRMQGRSRRP